MQGQEAPPPFASVLASAPPYPLVLPASPKAEDKLAASQETPRPNIDVLQRAADKGDPQAQLAMAVRYAFGDGFRRTMPTRCGGSRGQKTRGFCRGCRSRWKRGSAPRHGWCSKWVANRKSQFLHADSRRCHANTRPIVALTRPS